ncbi:MAG: hypothetical protein JWQ84_2257 [Mucilaginibacter sp.]|jgi:hypothetical protein|nr:hypothetical protein [Mucilaginibacter sp.]MDB5017425.1 hypothetical protein [Mucilaginibacter sp.]
MIKPILKTLLTLFICCSAFIAKAQLGYNFSQWDIGTSVAFNQVKGDAQTQTTMPSINFNITFNSTPYVNYVLEAQLGKLRGGDSVATSTGRYFNNDFYAIIFRGQLQFGEFLDYSHSQLANAFKNLYVSAGVGFINNHITQINRYSKMIPGFYTGGQDRSQDPFIPLRIGYEFKLYNKYEKPSVKIDFGYEANIDLSDNLDGFTTPGHHDMYTQFTMGVKFALGGLSSYRKQIIY